MIEQKVKLIRKLFDSEVEELDKRIDDMDTVLEGLDDLRKNVIHLYYTRDLANLTIRVSTLYTVLKTFGEEFTEDELNRYEGMVNSTYLDLVKEDKKYIFNKVESQTAFEDLDKYVEKFKEGKAGDKSKSDAVKSV